MPVKINKKPSSLVIALATAKKALSVVKREKAKALKNKKTVYTKNPASFPTTAKATRELKSAMDLYRNFSGHEPEVVGKIKVNPLPKVGIVIGDMEGVAYETTRDGVTEKYFHKFNKRSRPLLCSSFDGKQLFIFGGRYNFTEDGIVDKSPLDK